MIFQMLYRLLLIILNNKYPKTKPPTCASQEMFWSVIEINIWDKNQKIIKNFALMVVGNKKPNGTRTNNLALGNIYTYAPIKPDTMPDAPTIGVKLFWFK